MNTPRYVPFPTNCNYSFASLEWAAIQIGPAFIYELHVAPKEILSARNVLRELLAFTEDHPFSPHLNLVADEDLSQDEWFLSANGRAVGSPGVR